MQRERTPLFVRATPSPTSPLFPDTAHKRVPDDSHKRHVRVNGSDVPLHAPGVVRGSDLKAAGLRVYDPGLANTLSCTSSITAIDGNKGILSHRGYRLEELVQFTSYTEVAHLLVRGALPSRKQFEIWTRLVHAAPSLTAARAAVRALPRDTHPMGALVCALAATGAHEHNPMRDTVHSREDSAVAVLRAMPALAAGVLRHSRGARTQFLKLPSEAVNWSAARRFLYLVEPAFVSGSGARVAAVEALLIVHADHEQNCSTAALRHLASSGVDVFSAVAGATAALYGPLHGGASEAVVRMLGRVGGVDGVHTFIDRVKEGRERLMGFGHRVYKNYDPRARIIGALVKDVVREARGNRVLLDVAQKIEEVALKDEYFVRRKLFPNVDFYSGLVYLSMGFQPTAFPVMFALGRCAGWIAHWLEFMDDSSKRIVRPHQIYVGETAPRVVVPMGERDDAELLPWTKSRQAKL